MSSHKVSPPWHIVVISLVAVAVVSAVIYWVFPEGPRRRAVSQPRQVQGWYYVWPDLPEELVDRQEKSSSYSNIAPRDYVGPETCASCHPNNHEAWSKHPHRWMNAEATEESIIGRFDGTTVPLRGGKITVYQEGNEKKMRVHRGAIDRIFTVSHTIGRRYHQYYIGMLESGTPVSRMSEYKGVDAAPQSYERPIGPDTKLVLPLGYRIEHDQWVPIYGVYDENDSDFTPDPYENFKPVAYYGSCALCHTTIPQGYRMLLDHTAVGLKKPELHYDIGPFLDSTFSEMTDASLEKMPSTAEELDIIIRHVSAKYEPEKAVTLGISCEACHYGGREHVESEGQIPPRFLPSSPHLIHGEEAEQIDFGRTHQENINLICGQCHGPPRMTLPGGASRINSSEYRDAINGSCYSQLTCVQCHEPHSEIGSHWPNTPDQDDASCLTCHSNFKSAKARDDHTHHPRGSQGARCMNCHMPHVTEGVETIVRTHQISSPTNSEIIEEGGVNACNICHLDQSIDWTIQFLGQWYGAQFDEDQLADRYADRNELMGRVWLQDSRYEIRRIGIGVAQRAGATWLSKELSHQLDDMYNINRQFAQTTLESLLGIDLDSKGYYYWMTPHERTQVLDEVYKWIDQVQLSAGSQDNAR